MPAILDHHQTGIGDVRRHLLRPRERRGVIVEADDHHRRHPDLDQQVPAVGAGHDGRLLAREAISADVQRHLANGLDDRVVGKAAGMDDRRQQRRVHAMKLAEARLFDEPAAACRRLRRVGGRLRVDQGQTLDAMHGAPQDLEADIAAHREAAERKPFRRRA